MEDLGGDQVRLRQIHVADPAIRTTRDIWNQASSKTEERMSHQLFKTMIYRGIGHVTDNVRTMPSCQPLA